MKRKILFMTNNLAGGGAEKVLQTLLAHLDYNKYDVTLYSMYRDDVAFKNYPSQIQYKAVFDQYLGDNKFCHSLSNVLTKIKSWLFNHLPSSCFYALFFHKKYDVEVAFIEGESTKILSGSTNRKSKKYAWVHIDLLHNPWTDFLYRSIQDERNHYQSFNRILCVSESVRRAFLEKYKISPEKISVQYNPIDRSEIIAKSLLPCDVNAKDKFRMIAVGRLVEQKGFDRLIQVCAKLVHDGYEFELLILGEGEERPSLEKMIQQFKLEDQVHLLGFLKNPYPVISTGDLLVCSSRSEGISTVVSEGIILGLPVVSTDCAGIREIFGPDCCGIITENNSSALYNALKKVLDHPDQLNGYREAALKRGKSFSLNHIMQNIENLLDS
ncbi:MAG: glycosyltransferase [Lachnospiraceae bacterium]|jgi:glycosyltransferase involved in cell wall biosynthesis|nr:glycosyltransferase [Lachnospiraceae bacterium]MCH4064571.1 glycosyltransferase [Lachnospiraceae bacterium]MCH4104802.1 glycosyltransferase [Lachnospiraceae bacterium]MCI1308555.1 glycosyltransferase [Lachnospiraceae bacterium]MCI1357498.1 glycosyltransferase [Lachnospiraceae bacterium]